LHFGDTDEERKFAGTKMVFFVSIFIPEKSIEFVK